MRLFRACQMLLVGLAAACQSVPAAVGSKTDAGAGAQVFSLVVSKRWTRASGGPLAHDEVPEQSYKPATGIEYQVVLRNGGTTVAIRGPGLDCSGSLAKSDGGVMTFTLDQGLFAGGRFVMSAAVDVDAQDRAAELTVYGSGVPIVSSDRGVLVAR
jgi:hypothetical protein